MADRLDRIAVVVDSVDDVTKELNTLFGMTFEVFDVAAMGIRVALGNDGLELVEDIGGATVEHLWRRPLAAIVMHVDDIDGVIERMQQIGVDVDHEVATPGGVREVSFGNNYRDIPLVVCDGDGDVTDGVGVAGLEGDYEPTITKK